MKTPAQPNANLTLLHLCLFTGAMLSIFAWGLICLERDLAAAAGAPALVAASN